jgi:hypothetical protein
MSPIKPSFPNPSTSSLKTTLDQLGAAVDAATAADGSLDVAKLEAKLGTLGEAGKKGLGAIRDTFKRTELREVTGACGGGTYTQKVQIPAKQLDAAEVKTLLQAIVAAKDGIEKLDANHDGVIAQLEAKAAKDLQGLGGELAASALAGSLTLYRKELSSWNSALSAVRESVTARKDFDRGLDRVAGHHAETKQGAEAILWAYRELATKGSAASVWHLDEKLEDAETSFLRFIPFFGRNVKKKAGHLSDGEIRKFLKTDDLPSFVSEKKASVTARVGDFDGWLAGKDLPGADQLSDPDFHFVSSGC